MVIKTSDTNAIKPFLKNLYIPPQNSHKGQNGKVLIIGGSSLFHAASIWGAEVASHFVDLVHYSSTEENNKVFVNIKSKFRDGIVVAKKDILSYVSEDDCILVGLGMVRGEISSKLKAQSAKLTFEEVLKIGDEPTYTWALAKFLIDNFPEKKFVFDAGSIQMLDPSWLRKLKERAIVTPHVGEFRRLFGQEVNHANKAQTMETVKKTAEKYNCAIVLKAVSDFISDGKREYIIEGGNAGLTKGGTGDVLAGLITSFHAKNDIITSCVLASFLLKRTAERLFERFRYWYNIGSLIETIPETLTKINL